MLTSLSFIFLAGLDCGKIILSVAVMSIVLTAPLGALGMDLFCEKLLQHE